MKKIISLLGLPFMLLFFTLSCEDKSTEPSYEIIVKPTVKKSSINYNKESFRTSFPDLESLNKIGDAYKSNYSQEIKNQFIEYINNQLSLLGENKETFMECMELTGCKETNSISLPTNVEKAKYEGEEVWIIQLVWGMEPKDLGHYKCFAIGISQTDTLDFIRCW